MFKVVVEKVDGILVTTSNRVAEELDVQHKHLLDKIDDYVSKFQSAELSADFYIPSKFKDNRNRTYRNYLITKKGIAQLIGGYSSAVEKAFDLNVAYINRFEEMEKTLEQQERIDTQNILKELNDLKQRVKEFPMTWLEVEAIDDQINNTIKRRMVAINSASRILKNKLKKEIMKDIQLRFGVSYLCDLKSKDYIVAMSYIFNWIEPYQLRIENTQLQII